MKLSHWAPVCACFGPALVASRAEAHSPIAGLGGFYSHFLDPVVVPSHALLLVGAALLLGQQGRAGARAGLVALAACFVCALAASGAGLHVAVREQGLLVGAAALGAAVSLGRPLPVGLVAVAGAAAGLALGFESEIDGAGQRETLLVVAGLGAGVLYFSTLICGLVVLQTRDWQRIGVRIAGSWIVAVSVMALALSIAQQARRPASAQATPAAWSAPC